MTSLEARYREAMRWYPRSWREANESAVIGTLLDAAEAEGRREPRRADLVNLAVTGAATRFGVIVGYRGRGVIAANAVATGLAYALTTTFTTSWAPLASIMRIGFFAPTFGPFIDLGPILAALWALAAIGAVVHKPLLTRSASVAIVLATVGMEVVRTIHYTAGSLSQYSLVFNAALATVSLVGTIDRRRSFGILIAGWLATFIVIAIATDTLVAQSPNYLWSIGPANAAGLTLALASVCLVAGALANVKQPQTAKVVLLSSLPWLLMWAIEVATNPRDYFEFPFPLYAAGLLLATYSACVALLRRSQRRTSNVHTPGPPEA